MSLSTALLEEAKALGVNISKACERGLEAQIQETRARIWLEENRLAIESSNDFVEKNGLPLGRHREF